MTKPLRLVLLLITFTLIAPTAALAAPGQAAQPTISRAARKQLRQKLRGRIGHYARGKKQWVWKGAKRPRHLGHRPKGLGKLPYLKLGDITGFYLSHDTTKGRTYLDASRGVAILATRGTKSGPMGAYKTSIKYFEMPLKAAELKLIKGK